MKLSNADKQQLKRTIIELLREVPEGHKIKLNKDLLEDLLFDVVVLNKEEGIIVKLPVWSGYFLHKIDLSEVDFTDVSWTMFNEYDLKKQFGFKSGDIVTNDDVINIISKIRQESLARKKVPVDFIVTFEGTNAKIDLTKSFEAKHSDFIIINDCNFSGLDFSWQDLTGIKCLSLSHTDISGTKLSVPSNITLEACCCWLKDIDLSAMKIDAIKYSNGDYANLGNCNLTNSGVQVSLNLINLDELTNRQLNELKKILRYAMSHGLLGCYVNGKKVLLEEEKKKLSQEKKEEYEKMKDGIFDSITRDIVEQIVRMGK